MARLLKRKATEDSEGSQKHAKISSNSGNEKNGPKEAPRASLLNPQSVVKIIVGKEAKEFFVHKEVLCRYSPYFAGALRDEGFREAAQQSITIDHIKSGTFGAFVYWVYAQKIDVALSTNPEETIEGEENDKPSFALLIDLWILADYLQVPLLQNLAIKMIHEKQMRLNVIPIYKKVHEETPSGNMLERLFTDFYVWGNGALSTYDEGMMPDAALRGIVQGFAKRCKTPTPPNPLDDIQNYYVKTD